MAILATVGTVVATADLSKGVLVGVLLPRVFFAGKVARLSGVASELSPDGRVRTYFVRGQVFFASAEFFADAVDATEPVERIVIDVTDAHFWDISAIGALDRVVIKARRRGRDVEVIGLNAASETMVERFAAHRKGEALAPHCAERGAYCIGAGAGAPPGAGAPVFRSCDCTGAGAGAVLSSVCR